MEIISIQFLQALMDNNSEESLWKSIITIVSEFFLSSFGILFLKFLNLRYGK